MISHSGELMTYLIQQHTVSALCARQIISGDKWDLNFPSIFDVEVYNWRSTNWYSYSAEERSNKEALRGKVWGLILREKRLLTQPVGGEWFYTKSLNYLCIAFIESGLEWQEIENQIANAFVQKRDRYQSIYKAWRGKQVVEDEGVIKHYQVFMERARELGCKSLKD